MARASLRHHWPATFCVTGYIFGKQCKIKKDFNGLTGYIGARISRLQVTKSNRSTIPRPQITPSGTIVEKRHSIAFHEVPRCRSPPWASQPQLYCFPSAWKHIENSLSQMVPVIVSCSWRKTAKIKHSIKKPSLGNCDLMSSEGNPATPSHFWCLVMSNKLWEVRHSKTGYFRNDQISRLFGGAGSSRSGWYESLGPQEHSLTAQRPLRPLVVDGEWIEKRVTNRWCRQLLYPL